MAELLLKIGDRSTGPLDWKDGDIICAFNDRRIACCHAQHICNYRLAARNSDGLILLSEVARDFYEISYTYRFERVSQSEVKRITLADNSEEIISGAPNAKGEAIDVPRYISRRKARNLHRLFGNVGREIWYGGRCDYSDANVTAIWEAIEVKTLHQRVDFQSWPMGRLDVRSHLPIRTDDFADARAKSLVEILYATNVSGEFEWEMPGDVTVFANDPPKDTLGFIEKRKRRHKVNWRDDLSMSARDIADASDRTKDFDLRSRQEYSRVLITRVKPGER